MQQQHSPTDTVTGILLANLGTPDSPSVPAVRRYLRQFLSDRRVVELPRLLWWPLLNLVILNTRPRRSAKAYRKIWTDEGSPLLVISRRQQQALQATLDSREAGRYRAVLAMCYGSPSVADGLQELRDAGVRRVLVLPLYPQYSATSSAAVFDAVTRELQHWRDVPELRFVRSYHDHAAYIQALADSVRRYQQVHGVPERLLMSFHGIPQQYADSGDPYACECEQTAMLLAGALELQPEQWQFSFQSRLGPKQWLRPYTDRTLRRLGRDGVRRVQVICPGFSVDCLETLEEIALENRAVFLEAGGKEYGYIPCLNEQPLHIDMMLQLVDRHCAGWPV